MKLKKLTALLLAFATSVCAFSQVNLKNMSAEELIDLKANIEKELFARKPEAFTAAKNPLEGLSFSRNVSGWSSYTETLTFGATELSFTGRNGATALEVRSTVFRTALILKTAFIR